MRGPWLLLQLADSAFPVGGFAHSGGLEALAQLGELSAPGALASAVEQALWQAGHGALPLVRAARLDPGRLGDLDARCEVFLVNPVANRASRQQGRALLDTAARIFPEAGPLRARAAGLRLHLSPVFGALACSLDLPLHDALAAFLHLTARGALSAAVRLGLAGPHEAQALHHGLFPLLDRVLADCGSLDVEQLRQVAPMLDLIGATHDRLYSRLFLS